MGYQLSFFCIVLDIQKQITEINVIVFASLQISDILFKKQNL